MHGLADLKKEDDDWQVYEVNNNKNKFLDHIGYM